MLEGSQGKCAVARYNSVDAYVVVTKNGVRTAWQIDGSLGIGCQAVASDMSLEYRLLFVSPGNPAAKKDLPSSIFQQHKQECFALLSICKKAATENNVRSVFVSFASNDEWMLGNAYEDWVANSDEEQKLPMLRLTYVSEGGRIGVTGATLEIDSSQPPSASKEQIKRGSVSKSTSDSDCFIATAAFGSPSQKEVQRFRLFRDRYLLRNKLGRASVRFYYRHSPGLASWIGSSHFRRRVARVVLNIFALFLPF